MKKQLVKKCRFCVIIGTKKFYCATATEAATLVQKYGARAKLEFLPTEYERGKEHARAEAMRWQHELANGAKDWGDVWDAWDYFEKLARRFGLVREFRENGII